MENLKKALAFFASFAILIGAGCGIGNSFYVGNPFAGVCCIVLTIAAIPTLVKLIKFIIK